MKKGLKTKKTIVKNLKSKGWKLHKRLATGEIWEKGNEKIFYDNAIKETFMF